VFHANFADQIEMVMFLKNVSIAGGFLLLVANGAGALSVDRRSRSNDKPISAATFIGFGTKMHDARHRVQEFGTMAGERKSAMN